MSDPHITLSPTEDVAITRVIGDAYDGAMELPRSAGIERCCRATAELTTHHLRTLAEAAVHRLVCVPGGVVTGAGPDGPQPTPREAEDVTGVTISVRQTVSLLGVIIAAYVEATQIPRHAGVDACCRATAELIAHHMLQLAQSALHDLTRDSDVVNEAVLAVAERAIVPAASAAPPPPSV